MDIVQARPLYTQKVIAVYDEQVPVYNFLQSLFKTKTTSALDVAVEIRRGENNIAVEVQRGGDSNKNTFNKSSIKIFRPPMYSESKVANAMSSYELSFGQGLMTRDSLASVISETARELSILRDKISKAKELQCSEVLFDGTVTTKFNDIIDFGRLALSKVDLATLGGYWSSTGTDVEAQLIGGAEFIRNTGNSAATRFDLVMPGAGFVTLKKTDFYKDDANRDAKAQLQDIKRPIGKANGSSYHGTVNAGSYIFDIWTYDAVYKDASGDEQRFIPDNKAVMLPIQESGLILAHGGIPFLNASGMPTARAGEYLTREAIDRKKVTHEWFVESAPLATTYTPDKAYTMQILGEGGGQG